MPASDTRIAVSYETRKELRHLKARAGVDTYDAAISLALEDQPTEDPKLKRES
ncbi:hypothetical protein ACOJIV_22710 [Haloarcula sp. AONF1]|mgnify:CR=1 FL=1